MVYKNFTANTSMSSLCSGLERLSLYAPPHTPTIFTLPNDTLKHIVYYAGLENFLSLRSTCKAAMIKCSPAVYYTNERLKKIDTKTVAEFARCVAANKRWFFTLKDPIKQFFKENPLTAQQQFFAVLASHPSLCDARPLFLQCSDTITDVCISQASEQPSHSVAELLEAFTHMESLTLNKIPATSIQLCTQKIANTVKSLDLSRSAALSVSDFQGVINRLPALRDLKISLSAPETFDCSGLSRYLLESLAVEYTMLSENEMNVQGIEKFSALTELSITGATLSQRSFSSIAMIPGLEELSFKGKLVSPEAIQPLGKVSTLKILKLISDQLKMPSVHKVLENKSGIRAVSLSFNGHGACTAADCMKIAVSCQNLTCFCLYDCLDATDAEIRGFFTHMSTVRPLTKLNISLPLAVEKTTVSLLFKQASLTQLHLRCQSNALNQPFKICTITSLSITQQGDNQFLLDSLETLSNLKYLYLSLPFTDQDVTKVCLAPVLDTFMYKYEFAEEFTGHGFKMLCGMRSMRQIDILSVTSLTRMGVMSTLKKSPHIRYCRVLSPFIADSSLYRLSSGLYQLFQLAIEDPAMKEAARIFQGRHITYEIDP